MRIDTPQKLVLALLALLIGFNLPEIWAFVQSLFG